MSYMGYVKELIQRQPSNSVIEAERVYRMLPYPISRRAYNKILMQMVRAGEIIPMEEGVYCCARKSCTGVLTLPSDREIAAYYIEDNRGLYIGYALYRAKGLTTQISKKTEVLSVGIKKERINIRGVDIERLPESLSPNLVYVVEILEILEHYGEVEDFNHGRFLHYMEEYSRLYSEVDVQRVLALRIYKKTTIALLKRYLEYFGVQNNLGKLLSSKEMNTVMSEEKIYEFT